VSVHHIILSSWPAMCQNSNFDGDLMKFWQKQVGTFLDHPVLY